MCGEAGMGGMATQAPYYGHAGDPAIGTSKRSCTMRTVYSVGTPRAKQPRAGGLAKDKLKRALKCAAERSHVELKKQAYLV